MRRAIVVGRARCALEEYAASRVLCDFNDVLVVGQMGASLLGRIDHWVSFHVELFDLWATQRAAAGLAPVGCYWGARYKGRNLGETTTRCRPLRYVPCLGGSSGFVAVQVALDELHADRVVLVGVPMRAEDAHVGSDESWREANKYWATWEENMPRLLGRVRSMSGRTRDALGYPDKAFLGL